MKTINQINQIIKTSELWELYRKLSNERKLTNEEYYTLHKRWLKEYVYLYEGREYKHNRRSLLYCEIYKEMPVYKNDTVVMADGRTAYLRLEVTLNGVMFSGYYYTPRETKYFSKIVRSKETFETFSLKEFYYKHIEPTIFYPEGFFRDIQIQFSCSKQEAKELYKAWRQRQPTEPQTRSEWYEIQLRKLNIETEYACLSENTLKKLYHQYKGKRQPELTQVVRPSLAYLFDEYDDEEEIMAAAQDYFNQKNVIFV